MTNTNASLLLGASAKNETTTFLSVKVTETARERAARAEMLAIVGKRPMSSALRNLR